ncbi:asparagine synthase (glutamine-hydrolyzing) [Thalassospira sp. MBR-102]|uniref:asparagine synthase (glutamine-hydrolyzing) n=1 Tax=Thalassospira sp. MBR-102 TaxID=3156466 RepID=UPI00339AEC4D
MCGLAGATASGEQPRVHAALHALAHRGPDGEGCWSDPAGAVTLGVRRLITTDPGAAANQPLISPDGRFVLAFNGYIAGHRRRISSLRQDGFTVESDSDAALFLTVLGNALRDGGDPAKPLGDLSGQYAFALWDCALRQLWLGRDPVGIKPLYFVEYGSGNVAFASEIAALRCIVPTMPDQNVFPHYLAHLFVPAPATGFADIRQLRPGELICWQDGKIDSRMIRPATCHRYDGEDAVADLRGAIRQSVADAMDADRNVGMLLSGGMDSGAIAAMACDVARERGQKPPPGFVMQFRDAGMDETPRARQLAKHLGMELHVIAAPEEPEEILGHLKDGLRAFGSPFGNPSIVLMQALSAGVSKHVPVCLAGDGGDELFGGYPRYRAARMFRFWQHIPGVVRRAMAGNFARTLPRGAERFVQGGQGSAEDAFHFWNDRAGISQVPSKLSLAADLPNGELSDRLMAFDRKITLPGNQLAMSDRCGMAYGLEYRVPLLGHEVMAIAGHVQAGAHLRGGGKALLRAVIAPMMPDGYLCAGKIGFNPPIAEWLVKLGALLWGNEGRIIEVLFGDLPVTNRQRRHYWHRATQARAPDMALSLWAMLVWRLREECWQSDIGEANISTAMVENVALFAARIKTGGYMPERPQPRERR